MSPEERQRLEAELREINSAAQNAYRQGRQKDLSLLASKRARIQKLLDKESK